MPGLVQHMSKAQVPHQGCRGGGGKPLRHLAAALKRKHATHFHGRARLQLVQRRPSCLSCTEGEDSPAVAAGQDDTGGKAVMLLSWLAWDLTEDRDHCS